MKLEIEFGRLRNNRMLILMLYKVIKLQPLFIVFVDILATAAVFFRTYKLTFQPISLFKQCF